MANNEEKNPIEQALDTIHREGLPLNHTSVTHQAQQLDDSVTDDDVWQHMITEYGWSSLNGFWSDNRIK